MQCCVCAHFSVKFSDLVYIWCCSVLQCVAVSCSVLQCVAVCCRVLQCVAVCCSVLLLVEFGILLDLQDGLATMSRLLKIIGLFCKRAL